MGIELFDGFKEVITDMTLTNWEELVTPLPDVDKTVAHFEQTLHEMYPQYVGAEARNTQIEYYKIFLKPIKMNPLDHASQMLTLAHFGNKPPGIEPPFTEEQVKKCIFHSFPPKWQQECIHSGAACCNYAFSGYY
jgi:hypothetical protein